MAHHEAELIASRLALLSKGAGRVLIVSARSDIDTERLCREISTWLSDEAETHPSETTTAPRILCARGLLDDPDSVARLREAEAVVLAVRPGNTTRRDLESCRRLLDAAGVKLLAAVMTK